MTYDEMLFGKKIEDMTTKGEVQDAIYSMEDTFRDYREIGQGISSKESVTHRELKERLVDLEIMERFGVTDPDEVATLKAGLREMFAPA